MKILLSAFLLISTSTFSQNLAAYLDFQKRLRAVENDRDQQIYHLQPIKFGVTNNYILYQDANNNLQLFRDGQTEMISPNLTDFEVSDYLSVVIVGPLLYVFDGYNLELLTENLGRYDLTDSLVMFYDNRFQTSYVYYAGDKYEIEGAPINAPLLSEKMAANVMGYRDRNNNLMMFYRGEFIEVINSTRKIHYKVGQDILVYIDPDMNSLNVVKDYEPFEIDAFVPKSFEVGDNMVLFVNNVDEFKVYRDGEVEMITNIAPDGYRVVDSMATYWSNSQFFALKGFEGIQLEGYLPSDMYYDDGNLCYLDNLSRMVTYTHRQGKKQITNMKTGLKSLMGNYALYTLGGINDVSFHSFTNNKKLAD
ncbi:MAG: hypothetical protein MRY83_02515 [Flavobacteriales bacterium]|nr:hypothetical protein [Flavobacteriales bacterium]